MKHSLLHFIFAVSLNKSIFAYADIYL